MKQEKTHFVLGTVSERDRYIFEFRRTSENTKTLRDPDDLRRLTPDNAVIVILDGAYDEGVTERKIWVAVEWWRERWRGLGMERINEAQLFAGLGPYLLAAYDKKMEKVEINFFSQSDARYFIEGLSDKEAVVLLAAIDARKKRSNSAPPTP